MSSHWSKLFSCLEFYDHSIDQLFIGYHRKSITWLLIGCSGAFECIVLKQACKDGTVLATICMGDCHNGRRSTRTSERFPLPPTLSRSSKQIGGDWSNDWCCKVEWLCMCDQHHYQLHQQHCLCPTRLQIIESIVTSVQLSANGRSTKQIVHRE